MCTPTGYIVIYIYIHMFVSCCVLDFHVGHPGPPSQSERPGFSPSPADQVTSTTAG